MRDELQTDRASSLHRCDYVLGLALWAISAPLLCWLGLAAKPGYLSLSDCTPYLIQADIFRHGQLARAAPPEHLQGFFATNGMIVRDGREFSRQPPGASALFALLWWIVRDVRLAPPLISALALALNYLWIRRISDRRTALLSAALCLAGPLYPMLGASCLSYAPSALFLSAAMCVFTAGLSRGNLPSAGLTGFFIGMQFVTRPFTAILSAVALGTTRMFFFRERPRLPLQTALFIGGLVPGVVSLLVYNHLVTGSCWPLAFTLYGPDDRIGFGLRGLGQAVDAHTPTKAFCNLLTTLGQMGEFFFASYVWLIPLAAWWLGRILTGRRSSVGVFTRWDTSLLLITAVIICGHMLYWYPRAMNYFETYPFLAALIARGIWCMIGSGRAMRWLARLVIVTLTVWGPLNVWVAVRESVPPIRAIHNAIDCARQDAGNLLIFTDARCGVLGEELPEIPEAGFAFTGLFNFSLSKDEPVIYALDCGRENAALAARYPNHTPCRLLIRPVADAENRAWPFEPVLAPLSVLPNTNPDLNVGPPSG
ncbi:MAG: glycosyltransferase family 39 protein [Phycisphaerae bacterium]|nr:glycosyltransferase family 39 protein [Phycisphaerae bacterium]